MRRPDRTRSLRPRSAVSLLELLAVVTILGVIAVVVIPRMSGNSLLAKKQACYAHKANIDVQAELWYRNQASWPANNLSDIGSNTAYFPEGLPTCPVDGAAYTLDAASHQVSGHSH